MTRKQVMLLLAAFSFAAGPSCAAGLPQGTGLKVYMPREIVVEEDNPQMGQVTILRGSDALVAKAEGIILGRFSTPQQRLVIDKNIILGRLASNGIPASDVTMTGAEETVVKRQHGTVTSDRFMREASAFLKANLPNPSINRFDVIRIPGDLVLPGSDTGVRLECRVAEPGARNQCKVQVTVYRNDRPVGRQDVVFRCQYDCRRAVTTKAIGRGEMISKENVKIVETTSNFPPSPGWQAPYGQVAVRPIAAETVITDSMVGAPQPEVILKRNQNVTIKIESAGLLATAVGKVLQDGAAGEYIKVQNVDSNIIVIAKVNEDGTVEPIY